MRQLTNHKISIMPALHNPDIEKKLKNLPMPPSDWQEVNRIVPAEE